MTHSTTPSAGQTNVAGSNNGMINFYWTTYEKNWKKSWLSLWNYEVKSHHFPEGSHKIAKDFIQARPSSRQNFKLELPAQEAG